MIIDTDVLIWYLKGNNQALVVINQQESFYISVVTYMELVQGMRNKKELDLLRKALFQWKVEILYITEQISSRAMILVENHYLSHSLQLADALIGSTALTHGLKLLTGNYKHYKIIKELQLLSFNPDL